MVTTIIGRSDIYSAADGYAVTGTNTVGAPYYAYGIVVSNDAQSLYIMDRYRLRKFSFATGNLTSIAGFDSSLSNGIDGVGTFATFGLPGTIDIDFSDQYVYLADGNHKIRRILVSFPPAVLVNITTNSIRHNVPSCFVNPLAPATLYSCDIAGGMNLTLVGKNFDSSAIIITNGLCVNNAVTFIGPSVFTCRMTPQPNGYTNNITIITANGGLVTIATVKYAQLTFLVAITGACLSGSGSTDISLCPYTGGIRLDITGANFDNSSVPIADISFCNRSTAYVTPPTPTIYSCIMNSFTDISKFYMLSNGGATANGTIAITPAPVITSIRADLCASTSLYSISQCPLVNGTTTLTITGANFHYGTISLSQAVCAGPITVASGGTELRCPLIGRPASTTLANIAVVGSYGGSSVSAFSVLYSAPPTVTSITSAACNSIDMLNLDSCSLVAVNVSLLITGTNFDNFTTVAGGVCAANTIVASASGTQLTCTLVAGSSGALFTADVSNFAGTTSSFNLAFYNSPIANDIFGCTHDLLLSIVNCPVINYAAMITVTGGFFDNTTTLVPNICVNDTIVRHATNISCILANNTADTSQTVQVATTLGGLSIQLVRIRYSPAPTITAITGSPCVSNSATSLACSSLARGSLLTITGTVLDNSTSVSGGICNGSAIANTDGTELVCARADNVNLSDFINITVSNNVGGLSTNSAVVFFVVPPTITSITSTGCDAVNSLTLNNCPIVDIGAALTIIGANLNTSTVGSACIDSTIAVNVNSTVLTCLLAVGSAGTTVDVVVSNNRGISGIVYVSYALRPTISTITTSACTTVSSTSVTNCPVGGGLTKLITLTGTNMDNSTVVSNNTCMANTTVVNAAGTQLTCSLAAATVSGFSSSLTVSTIRGGSSAAGTVSLAYASTPFISSIQHVGCVSTASTALVHCPVTTTSTKLTITGVNLDDSAVVNVCDTGSVTVTNGGTKLICTLSSTTNGLRREISVVSPIGGTAIANNVLSVTSAFAPVITALVNPVCGGSNSLTLVACPNIASEITIVGTGFINVGSFAITPATLCASFPIISDNQISCVLNSTLNAPPVLVQIVTNGGTSNPALVNFLASCQITGMLHPLCGVTGDSLTVCPTAGGNFITIVGVGFGPLVSNVVTISADICVGALTHVIGAEDTRLVCALAANAGGSSFPVIVTSISGISSDISTPTIGYQIEYPPTPSFPAITIGGQTFIPVIPIPPITLITCNPCTSVYGFSAPIALTGIRLRDVLSVRVGNSSNLLFQRQIGYANTTLIFSTSNSHGGNQNSLAAIPPPHPMAHPDTVVTDMSPSSSSLVSLSPFHTQSRSEYHSPASRFTSLVDIPYSWPLDGITFNSPAVNKSGYLILTLTFASPNDTIVKPFLVYYSATNCTKPGQYQATADGGCSPCPAGGYCPG